MKTLDKANSLWEQISSTIREIRSECEEYLVDTLKAAPNNRIDFYDKDGYPYGCETYITYDGGRHPEYASNAFSTVNAVFLKDNKIFVDCDDCDEYDICEVDWSQIYDVASCVETIIKN